MKAIRLKTEYLFNPMGIDICRPRLFWNCEDGLTQTAWQIQAFRENQTLIWDSKKQEGSTMTAVWGGENIPGKTRIQWQVRLWDERNTAGPWSTPAFFETGLLSSRDWKGQWIRGSYTPKRKKRYPADCFRKYFQINTCQKARLYITACGLYKARINDNTIDSFVMAPGITDYRKRIYYQTYDVTRLIRQGTNEISITLADGWYRGSTGAWGLTCQYGTKTRILAQLEITDDLGSQTVIATDSTWSWSNDGPVRFADNKDGEIIDARLHPSYSGSALTDPYSVIPSASNNVKITEHGPLTPRKITSPSGEVILDFGQNLAGYISFSLKARDGQSVVLRFGEMLDKNGEFTQKNIQCHNKRRTTPLQQVIYTCHEGLNHYKTTFAIFGFRYVLVQTQVSFSPEDFQAFAVYSDMEETGEFECSSALISRFYQNTLWSAKSNICDLPTDCPTRERHGWTGDAQIFCQTAAYLFDYMAFARKYLRDIYDQQKSNGCLPQIAPPGGVDSYMKVMDGSVGWADAGILIPWCLWKRYGDLQILEEYYDKMKAYAQFMQKRCGRWYPTAKRTGLTGEKRRYLSNCGQSYGEWAEPAKIHEMTWKDCAVPHPEVATAYTALIMDRMEEIADALGHTRDAKGFHDFGIKVRQSYQALCEIPQWSLDTDRQARLVRPLAFHLLTEAQESYARKRLVQAMEHFGWKIGTGFLSTPLILDVLSQIDISLAYRLLENEQMPGWLFMPKNGATTVWEAWEGPMAQKGIASLNHYSKGAVCQWLFETMCGIHVSGPNSFSISPCPGGHVTWARAGYQSIYGKIQSEWHRLDNGIQYTISVPSGCTAQIQIKGRDPWIQGPGKKTYFIRNE